MSDRSIDRAAARRRLVRQLAAASAVGFLAVGILGAYSDDEPNDSVELRRLYGPAQALGNGTARTYVILDTAGRPASLGVALSEGAMSGLPQTPKPGMPSAVMLMLALPTAAEVTGFDHVMLDWNPQGHEPEHVYTLPHFDFHFYTISEAEQMAIMPTAPQFAERASRLPPDEFVPNGYVSAHIPMGVAPAAATIPMMGLHWLDAAAPELHGRTFTGTFIYGSYDGRFIFAEPMITKAYIESVKSLPGNTVVSAVKVPAKYQRAGYYPTRYTISWDAGSQEYRIALDGLVEAP
jgi:hypothetical protein